MKYHLVVNWQDPDSFNEAVNLYLADGWQLYGNPQIAVAVDNHMRVAIRYAQAVTKP